jgi:hypothetical protein
VPFQVPGRGPTSARARRLAIIARRRPPPERCPAPCRHPGSRLKERPEPLTAPPTGLPRPHPMPPAPPRFPEVRPRQRRVSCRRFRRHPRPGQAQATRGPRGPQVVRELREFRDRRGLRPPRPTSEARGPARLVPRLRVPAGQQAQEAREAREGLRDSVLQAVPQAGLTSRLRDLRPGRPRRGPRGQVRPGRVRPDRADLEAVRVGRVRVQGRATTRSARPRPAWGRPLRPGLRDPVRLVSRLLAVRVSRRALQAVLVPPAALVRQDAAPAVPAVPAVPVPAVLVRAAPGRAR